MKKKIVFKRVKGSVVGCQLLPAGTVEAESRGLSEDEVSEGPGFIVGPTMRKWEAGSLPVFPEIELGLAAGELSAREFTLTVKCKNASPTEVVKVLEGTATDISVPVREEVTSTFAPLVKGEVKSFIEAVDKAGCFLGPLRVGVRLRMTDGSLVALPSPRLLVPNSSTLKVGIRSASVSGDQTIVRCVVLAQPVRLCWRVRSVGSFRSAVRNVEFMATAPASIWNSASEPELSGGIEAPLTMAGTLTPAGVLTDVSPDRSSLRSGSVSRGWLFPGVPAPMETALGAPSLFHKIGVLSTVPDVSDSWTLLSTSGTTPSLFSGKGETLDFAACTVPVGGWMTEVGGRRVVTRPESALPAPIVCQSQLPTGYDAAGVLSGSEVTEAYVRFADGTVLSGPTTGMKLSGRAEGWLREWVYPALGANLCCLVYTESDGMEKAVGFSLTDDAASGSSVSVGSLRMVGQSELSGLRSAARQTSVYRKEDPELIVDWDSQSVGLSSATHRLRIAGSRPAAVARVLPGSSSDIYPELYLTASDGIRVLRWNASGGWRPERLLSGEGCENPEGLIEVGDSVIALTRSGLLRLSNTTVSTIPSPELASASVSGLSQLPGADSLIGMIASPADYSALLKSGRPVYNPVSRLVRIEGETSSLTWDLTNGIWKAGSSGEAGTSPWLLTYPFEVGARRILSVELFGCGMAEEVTVTLYGSDTLGGWRLVRSGLTQRGRLGAICGSGARFWRLLVVGNLPEGALLTLGT